MRVLTVRNVHEALPLGLRLLYQEGLSRQSRNGPVIVAPFPVTTVYEQPNERVMFWPERDANPFFHLYESLWMLAGRNDVAGVVKYAKNMANYSDDGITFHGAYGNRWRFSPNTLGNSTAAQLSREYGLGVFDQLPVIARALKANPEDRRCVLEMWDAPRDLGRVGKDFPCNLTATFQRDSEGKLDLTVFNRSNDIIWGAYGANAVHFSFLLEYVALAIGCPVGIYRQISVNWHAYEATLNQVSLGQDQPIGKLHEVVDLAGYADNPYVDGRVQPVSMSTDSPSIADIDRSIQWILDAADSQALSTRVAKPSREFHPWTQNVWLVLEAHEYFRNRALGMDRYKWAVEALAKADQKCDWVRAAQEWILRRMLKAARDANSVQV